MSAAGQAPPAAAVWAARFLPVPRAAGGAEWPEAAGWGDDEAAPLAEDAAEDEDGEPGDADPGTPAHADAARDAAPAPAPGCPPAGCPAAVLPYATADT
jgi:hypothetical protein